MRVGTLPVKDTVMSHRRLKKAYLYVRRANGKRVVLLLSACFLTAVLVTLFMVLLVQDVALSGKIFPGVTVAGNAVNGMSRDQAKAAVTNTVVAKISEPLVLTYRDQKYKLDLAKIGLAVDVDKMVDEAFKQGKQQLFLERMWRRFLNKPLNVEIPVILKYDQAQLNDFLGNIADDLDYAARSASVDMSKGYPVVTSSKSGRQVKQDTLTAQVQSVLPTGNRKLEVPVEIVKPKVSEGDIGPIVVIKQSEHKFYLYQGSTLEDTYACAVGQPKYPTPNGRFEILEKKKDPWWYPPKSDWAKDLKPVPPGPGNPLGPYFMDLGNGFGIHSTPDEASLGYSVSHGCVRLSEWSAQQVFKVVEKGTPVYIRP
jgi:lipoprotein-anchoring transpeptidase ErfK/SrfK